jgi:hypothetical protein
MITIKIFHYIQIIKDFTYRLFIQVNNKIFTEFIDIKIYKKNYIFNDNLINNNLIKHQIYDIYFNLKNLKKI